MKNKKLLTVLALILAFLMMGSAFATIITLIVGAEDKTFNTTTPSYLYDFSTDALYTTFANTSNLEVTLGDMGSILKDMEASIYRLNQIYRKVLVLTGVTPDRFRDYNLAKVYPEVIEAMELESLRLYKLVDDRVEAIEFIAREGSKILGVSLRELTLKKDLLIAGIIRGNKVIIPSGNDCVMKNDSVIVVTTNRYFQDLDEIVE